MSAPHYVSGATSYDDVAVIVNTRSGTSVAIGSYFQHARSIPEQNMVYVSVDSAEEVDSTVFEMLRSQIEQFLIVHNLVHSIDYIVTTKGVPLKVNRGNTFSTSSPSASVESELALVLGGYADHIGQTGKIISPYYGQSQHFTRDRFGIYLVTRLDAYTLQQVLDMIDRSGPGIPMSLSAVFVLDQDPDWNATLPYLNTSMESARAVLRSRGNSVLLNTDSVYVTNRDQVAGYVSWGTNDHHAAEFTQHGMPHNSWAAGAIAETYVSTSGRSFNMPAEYGQSLIADVIQEGVSGAKGYVYEPFSSSMSDAAILFDAYSSGYNLAESFWMASSYLSWMDVVLGDPKTSIVEEKSILPVQLSSFNVFHAEEEHGNRLTWETISETGNFGFTVQWSDSSMGGFVEIQGSFVPGHGTTVTPQSYSWLHRNVPTGTYYYRLRMMDLDGTEHLSDARRVSSATSTEDRDARHPDRLELGQNYPNPFNPSTTITYRNPTAGRITLQIISTLGEVVATLVDEVQAPGTYSVPFFAYSRASGTYFCRIHNGTTVVTRKMILIR